MKTAVIILFVACIPFSACKTKTKAAARCGDGFIDPGEECDSSNLGDIQGCLQLGYYSQTGNLTCNSDCTLDTSVCSGRCGDGTVQPENEDCDGDNMPKTDCLQVDKGRGTLGCKSNCQYDYSGCEASALCGDGIISTPFEDCEGTELSGETCQSQGYHGGQLGCKSDDCKFDLVSCESFGRCGDGILQNTYEQCEGSHLDGQTCIGLQYFTGNLNCLDTCEYNLDACKKIESVSSKLNFGCILLSDGSVRCWGNNQGSQLGYPGPGGSSVPVTIGGLTQVNLISAGYFHACVVLQDGTGRCWGGGYGGQLGNGSDQISHEPVTVQGLEDLVSISAGYFHTCAVKGDGTAWCWGFSSYGQIGDGTTETMHPTPVQVNGISNALEIGTGSYHSCALLSSGAVQCWGYNQYGQLGDNSRTHSPIPVNVALTRPAELLSVGGSHACAKTDDGKLYCWGENGHGQLGVNNTTTPYSTVPVQATSDLFKSLSAGTNHTCIILTDNTLRCWGDNNHNQLGTNYAANPWNSRRVDGFTSPAKVASGQFHTCAMEHGGSMVRCLGKNDEGQLGDGTIINRDSPVDLLRD